jgi:hypothetical protein
MLWPKSQAESLVGNIAKGLYLVAFIKLTVSAPS